MTSATPFSIAPLPWAESALEPVISARTIGFHYGKHHQGYLNKLNAAVADTPFADQSLESVVQAAYDSAEHEGLFNNAAQVFNHSFYWQSLAPSPTTPSSALEDAIKDAFGDRSGLAEALVEAGAGQFGSGWVWLVARDGGLAVENTSNADTPMARGQQCLLTIDVWEHAYYLDHQNDRRAYLEAIVERHLDWAFASSQFEEAPGSGS